MVRGCMRVCYCLEIRTRYKFKKENVLTCYMCFLFSMVSIFNNNHEIKVIFGSYRLNRRYGSCIVQGLVLFCVLFEFPACQHVPPLLYSKSSEWELIPPYITYLPMIGIPNSNSISKETAFLFLNSEITYL